MLNEIIRVSTLAALIAAGFVYVRERKRKEGFKRNAREKLWEDILRMEGKR